MTNPLILAVSAVIVDDRDRVLLVERGHAPAKGLWSIPGGSLEQGEDFEAALRREVREETGLIVEVGREVWAGVIELAHGSDYEIHTFAAEVRGGVLEPGDDASQAVFTTHEEFVSLATTPRLAEILSKAGWPRTS